MRTGWYSIHIANAAAFRAKVPAHKQWRIFPPFSAKDAEKDGARMQYFVAESIAAPGVRNSLSAELLEKPWSEVSQGSPPRQPLMRGSGRLKVHVVDAGLCQFIAELFYVWAFY